MIVVLWKWTPSKEELKGMIRFLVPRVQVKVQVKFNFACLRMRTLWQTLIKWQSTFKKGRTLV